MTILHKGIRRKTTDVLDDYGQVQHLVNVRFKRVGELGRRAGLGKSTMAQLAGPVQFMIGAWSNEPYIVNGTGGDVTGTGNPLAYWTGATLAKPAGLAGTPVAPTVLSATPSPASGTAYVAGMVTWTVTVAYDGLSGPLIWTWPANNWNVYPNAPPTFINSVDGAATWDFDAGCLPGVYSFSGFPAGQVGTTLNGFLVDIFFSDYVVA